MTESSPRVRAALLSLAPGAAGGAVAIVLGRMGVATPWVAAAALGAGAITGAFTLAPALAPLKEWPRRLQAAARRLEELEAAVAGMGSEPAPLDVPADLAAGVPDDVFEDALAELNAALRDEHRLRELRDGRAQAVTTLLRRGRELTAVGDTAGGSKFGTLLDELEAEFRVMREQADTLLAQSIAGDEVSGLLQDHAGSGREALKKADGASRALDGHISLVQKLVHRLEARSREIEQVLLVLNDITEQTNLLALNAAIIAAQAGEQGKGFGVVADEMRNLSERAASSTKETEFLAQSLRDDVGQVLGSMGRAGESVAEVRGSVVEAGESGATILELGRRARSAARESTAAAERQASAIREISAKRPALEIERARVARMEEELLTPTLDTLAAALEQLEAHWQLGAVRDSLRARLEGAVRAMREHTDRDKAERQQLGERLERLRQSGAVWRDALAEGRRREGLVLEVTRDIRELTGAPPH